MPLILGKLVLPYAFSTRRNAEISREHRFRGAAWTITGGHQTKSLGGNSDVSPQFQASPLRLGSFNLKTRRKNDKRQRPNGADGHLRSDREV
jgi:hypothetical protein